MGHPGGEELMAVGRGNCIAKAEYLITAFCALKLPTRRVRWLYRLPCQPPEVALLPSPFDVHTAVEIRLGDEWVLVDATHDPGLAAAGFTVASWDGEFEHRRPTSRPDRVGIRGTLPLSQSSSQFRPGVQDANTKRRTTDGSEQSGVSSQGRSRSQRSHERATTLGGSRCPHRTDATGHPRMPPTTRACMGIPSRSTARHTPARDAIASRTDHPGPRRTTGAIEGRARLR